MTSTISSTNKKNSFLALIKWSLLKSVPVTVIYSCLLFFVLPILMYILQTNKNLKLTILEGIFFGLIPLIVSLFTILVGNNMFGSYQNKRSVDLYASFPVNKRTLFLSKYVTGLLIIIVPLAVLSLLGGLVPAIAGNEYDMGLFMIYIMQKVLTISIGAIASYTLFAFLSMCCGTSADTVISYLVINGAYIVTVSLFINMFSDIVPGYDYIMYTTSLPMSPVSTTALSPLFGTFLCGGLDLVISTNYSESISQYITEDINIVSYIIYWLVFSAIFFIASLFLAQIRKNENVQNGFIFKAPMNVIKLLTSVSGGVLFGNIFIMGFEVQIGTSGLSQLIYYIIGALIGSMFTFLILTFIYNRGISGFLKSLPNFLIAFGIVAVSYIAMSLGMFGADKYVPNESDVVAVSVSSDVVSTDEEWATVDTMYSWYYDTNKEQVKMDYFIEDNKVISNTIAMHQHIVDNLHEKNGMFYRSNSIKDPDYSKSPATITITYEMSNGKKITRSYDNLQYNQEQIEEDFDKIASSDAYKDQYFILGKCGIDSIESVSISRGDVIASNGTISDGTLTATNSENDEIIIKELLEALEKDLKADKSYMETVSSRKAINSSSTYEATFFGINEVITEDWCYTEPVIEICYDNMLEGDVSDYIGTMNFHSIYGVTYEMYVIPRDKYINTWKVLDKYELDVEENTEHSQILIENK